MEELLAFSPFKTLNEKKVTKKSNLSFAGTIPTLA